MKRCAAMYECERNKSDDKRCQTYVQTLALLCVRYVGTSVVNLDPVDGTGN
jgi:hypothetical protein